MRAGDFCAWDLDLGVGACAELLVEGEADGLDGDVGVAVALEERAGGAGLVHVDDTGGSTSSPNEGRVP